MTISGTVKTVLPLGTGVLAQQVIDPFNPSLFERMGVTAIVCVAAYYLVKYFMGQIDKKDTQIKDSQAAHIEMLRALHSEQAATAATNTTMLVTELRESRSTRDKLNEQLAALTRSNEALTREITAGRPR